MNAFNLSRKKILVTGASSGIGKQAAITISQNGAIVSIIGRNKQRLDETLKELKGNHHQSIVTDLSDHNEIDALIDKLPELNGVVYSAGIANLLPAKFIQPENISQMFKINYEAPVLITGKLLKKKKLKNNASIVFISSLATKDPIIGGALYGSTKGAIEAYSKVLCVELASRGIRSNCISPAYVKTEMIDFIQKEEMEKYEKIYPLGFGEAVDVAYAIVFLLSDASRWISGANLIMGGG